MDVTSCIDGRIRIRDADLREPSFVSAVREKLDSLPEIRKTEINRRTGSLLIFYDRIRTTGKKILAFLAQCLGRCASMTAPATGTEHAIPVTEIRSYFSQRRIVNLGMLASLLVSLGGAALGSKGLHIATGLLFIVLVGMHISGKLRPLFT